MRRTAAVLACLVAALGTCMGCSSYVVGRATPGAAVLAAAPRLRSCWVDSTPGRGSPLDGTNIVSCADPHRAETIWVNDHAFGAHTPYPTRADLADPDSATRQVVHDICSYFTALSYLGRDSVSYGLYVATAPRLPSPTEWAAGARWIRCDIVFGILTTEPAPGMMAGALKGAQSNAYHLCMTGTSESYAFVSCARPHDAEVLGEPRQLPPSSPWPGAASARQALKESCAGMLPFVFSDSRPPPGVTLDVFVGPEDTWLAGRLVTCVLVPSAGGRTTTTVLH